MQLKTVLKGLDYQLQGGSPSLSGISYDSRTVRPGDLFVAIAGLQMDGHDFVYEAKKNGAVAVVVERWISDLDVPQVQVANTRRALGLVSANFYDHPGGKLRVLGVTGTNGKTTTTYLIKSILEQAGFRVGLIGSIQTLIGDAVLQSERTTPESLDLQRLLAKMVAEKRDFVVMEVSSHALDLHRISGVPFAGALFTNLSQDHLDFHPTMEDYFQAKVKLFSNLDGVAAVNVDDEWGNKLLPLCTGETLTFGVQQVADFQATKIRLENPGISYILTSKQGQIPIDLQLTGQFNVYNSLSAAALCFGEGASLEHIKKGLEAAEGIPGRFERIENEYGLNVIVDYAHTPGGLENILRSARELIAPGKIILVFGAGGDRDKGKRPLMGAVAAEFADLVIVTSDNPRSEDPQVICSSIEKGLLTENPHVPYEIEMNRRVAIQRAVQVATPSDIVVIAGKGHETYQEFATERIHFDDREEVKRAIKELKD